MSVQVFLQGRILGIEEFLQDSEHFESRAHWSALLSEVLPRALLAELGLSRMLLGSSGGDQFFVVLPMEARPRADEFCSGADADIRQRTNGKIRLRWAVTENLGDWSDVRKRLHEDMQRKTGTPVPGAAAELFEPFAANHGFDVNLQDFAERLRETRTVSWSPDAPGAIETGPGKHDWTLGPGPEAIPYARHIALEDDGSAMASTATLASRSAGLQAWGVLRGDVDSFVIRLRRAQSIDEHLQLSVMYKQFFASELEMLCSLPEFWRKVTLLGTGGDDFAAYGAWDALIAMAREVQRLFQLFVDANLKEYPGPEGKTISMAISIAQDPGRNLAAVYADSGRKLELAKSSGKDSIHLLGRTLEWKQLAGASETRETMTRMIRQFKCSPQLLNELASFYREADQQSAGLAAGRGRSDRVERPWRFHRRLNMVLGGASREREFLRLRSDLISDFTSRRAAQVRLRPQGRVAVEWAKLETALPEDRMSGNSDLQHT
jgi:CRISPR-associated protein Csm1